MCEVLHPFEVFKKSGFEVDLASETGSYQADWLLQQKEWLKDEERRVWEDHNSEFRSKLDKLLKPADVKWEESIAANKYSRGDIISAVCHGGAIFPGIKDKKTGKSIISGKEVTGFTTQGEIEE
ncbi:hypothetical protein ST47_g5950 [Ascochyta rabiei]|uniref:Uncharacterized protein n=1 Tax=Didymella rabiei TaxID=5454 RepID=A0A163D3K5_DIDRA|nr:hypothetical protein ST47_g5950 [Ascochyta rabiei]